MVVANAVHIVDTFQVDRSGRQVDGAGLQLVEVQAGKEVEQQGG